MSTPSSMSLPPPPNFAGAPGQQQYENGATNGQGNPAHMPPPPLPPVVIPQNNNPIPTAMTSPGGDSNGMMSPSSGSGSFVRRAAPEPNKRALYVGGLDPRVTEDILRQIFETTGHVQNVKIIPDKGQGAVSGKSLLPIVGGKIYSMMMFCLCLSELDSWLGWARLRMRWPHAQNLTSQRLPQNNITLSCRNTHPHFLALHCLSS